MILYRYDSRYSNGYIHLDLEQWDVIKETKCGYWIGDSYWKRWVSKTTRKRFAYPTPTEALESFRARKRRQIKILDSQLMHAKDALDASLKCIASEPSSCVKISIQGLDFIK